MAASEDNIIRMQVEEDLQIFGLRPRPVEANETSPGTVLPSHDKYAPAEDRPANQQPTLRSGRKITTIHDVIQHTSKSPATEGPQETTQHTKAGDRPDKSDTVLDDVEAVDVPITVMGWNSGPSPLDAWLNQSAVPSGNLAKNASAEDEQNVGDLVAKEIEEIEIFRTYIS